MGKIGPFVGLNYEIGPFVGIGPVVGIGLFGETGPVVSLTHIQDIFWLFRQTVANWFMEVMHSLSALLSFRNN